MITMTLTSAACPLTSIMEDQIRAEMAGVSDVSGFRVDWEWLPPWRPADITDSGRDATGGATPDRSGAWGQPGPGRGPCPRGAAW